MPRGLVLASRDEHASRDGAFEVVIVAPVVVGDEALLNPLQTVLVAAQRKARRVVQVQGHPAVPHQPEVVANAGAHLGQLGDVGVHTLLALGRAVVQWHLAADEAEPFRVVRPSPGGVELQLISDWAAEELVHGLSCRILPSRS